MENKTKEFAKYVTVSHDDFIDEVTVLACEYLELEARLLAYEKQLAESKVRLESANAENERLAKELINIAIEHPCYKLSKELESENKKLRAALEEINREELNIQRPGGGYSRSAQISFEALKLIKE